MYDKSQACAHWRAVMLFLWFAWQVCLEVWKLQCCMWSTGPIYLEFHGLTIPLPADSKCVL